MTKTFSFLGVTTAQLPGRIAYYVIKMYTVYSNISRLVKTNAELLPGRAKTAARNPKMRFLVVIFCDPSYYV